MCPFSFPVSLCRIRGGCSGRPSTGLQQLEGMVSEMCQMKKQSSLRRRDSFEGMLTWGKEPAVAETLQASPGLGSDFLYRDE